MKRLVKQSIKSSGNLTDSQVMFAPEELVRFLSQIEELKNHRIKVITDSDGLKFAIGDYEYKISTWYVNVCFLTLTS